MPLSHQPPSPKTSLRASATQSRKSAWNTLKPVLFVLVFVVIGIGSFGNPTFVHAVPDDGNSNVGCPSGTVRTAKTKECVLNFIPLVGIPYIDNPKEIGSMAEYVSALYKISISIAAFLAVIKIIFAGVKYMLSDVVTDKGAAKKDIRGALIGLLIVIGAVLILNTINPQLRNLNVLSGEGVQVGLGKHKPILTDTEKLCASFSTNSEANNCLQSTCGYFDSPQAIGWLGYIPKLTGMDYALNVVGCAAICNALGGSRLDTSLGDSGTCVYPADRRVAAEARYAEENTLLEGTAIIDNMTTFPPTPLSSQTVIDDRRENPALSQLSDEDLIGYVSINWSSPEGRNILTEYDNNYEVYEYEYLRTICGKTNRIIKVPQALSRTGYYCVRD